MELPVINGQAGTEEISINVADEVFAVTFNEALVHQVVTAWMAGARAGTRAHKKRSRVRGGGRKPWRQKGTGRARAGTSRSPIWRGGGVSFAARPQCHAQKVNRKMYRCAMRSILSELVRQQRLLCVDEFQVAEPRTRLAVEALERFGLKLEEVLIVVDEPGPNLCLATRNLPRVQVRGSGELNPWLLVAMDRMLITQSALEKVEANLR